MELEKGKEVWWKPAVQIFGQVSSWVIVPVVGALILGKYLDLRYGTKPWLFLILTGLAFLVSTFGIVRTLDTYLQKIKKEEDKRDGGTN